MTAPTGLMPDDMELIDFWPDGFPLQGASALTHLIIDIAATAFMLMVFTLLWLSLRRLVNENRVLRRDVEDRDYDERHHGDDYGDGYDDEYEPEFSGEAPEPEPTRKPTTGNPFMDALASSWRELRPQYEVAPGGESLRIPTTEEQRKDFCWRHRAILSVLMDSARWNTLTDAAGLRDDTGATPVLANLGETSDGLHLIFDADSRFPLRQWVQAIPMIGRGLDCPDATLYTGADGTVFINLRDTVRETRLAIGSTPHQPQYEPGRGPQQRSGGWQGPPTLALPAASSLAAPTGGTSVELDYETLVSDDATADRPHGPDAELTPSIDEQPTVDNRSIVDMLRLDSDDDLDDDDMLDDGDTMAFDYAKLLGS